ncbi:MAG: DUF401 family protein [Thermodesulfovibrionales bacterium]
MLDIIRVFLVFGLMLVLLRRKVPVGYVMLLSSGAILLLYRTPPDSILQLLSKAAFSPSTVKLLLALSLIRVFELMLREHQMLTTMMEAVKQHVRSRRAVIISMPMLIGMLPSLGGAYFSAPMVKQASEGLGLRPEEKAFVNYWYRHPWEYVLPLYPGILLASAITGIHLTQLMAANAAAAIAVFLSGFAFSMRGLKKKESHHAPEEPVRSASSRKNLAGFLPIALLLVMVMVFRIELHYALAAIIVPLFVIFRYPLKNSLRLLRHGFTREVILLILGIMVFKEAFEGSGAVAKISSFFLEQQLPVLPAICLLPFAAGLLTGHTVGFVGSTFPLVLSIGGSSLEVVVLAFGVGFLGVLLSPVHLCLVLTREYFKADTGGMYRRIVPASLCVLCAVFLEYAVLSALR